MRSFVPTLPTIDERPPPPPAEPRMPAKKRPRHEAHSPVTRALRNVNVNGPDGAA